MDMIFKNEYVHPIMRPANIRIVLADQSHLKALHVLVQSIAAEDSPAGSRMALSASEGLRESLDHFDMINSDCSWTLIAFEEDQPVGIAILTRIPKLDARRGFLYLDELHVIPDRRRRGVAKALLAESIKLTRTLGLCGLRLLARVDNAPARNLYKTMGFKSNETMLYQFRVDRGGPQP